MRRNSFLILSACVLLIAACGKKGGKSGLMVPKDAAIVVHINSKSLTSKLSWEEITQTNWFKEMSKDATDTLAKQLLADPASSGIDTKADLVFYMKRQGKGGYLVFEGGITDASAFEKMLSEMSKEHPTSEVKKDGDFSYMTADNHGIVLWNKSNFAYIANAPLPNMREIWGRGGGSGSHNFPDDSLLIFGKTSLTLSGSNNLDADSRFADLVADGKDAHVWMNLAGYYGDLGAALSMMKLDVLYQDNVSATSIDFDNGKITAKLKQYYGEEMRNLLAKYKPTNVSADVINRIPSSNVAFAMAFNYPPDGLLAFLKVIGVDGMANGFLAEMNYSVEEFIKANKGEVVLSVSDVSLVQKQDTLDYGNGMKPYVHTSTKPDMKVLFATAVNDKAAFDKLVAMAWETSKKMGANDEMPKITYKIENNWFAASNSADQTNNFLAGNSSGKLAFADKITGHPFGMYIDLQKIIQTTGGAVASDESEKAGVDASLKMWQDVVASGGDYNDKAVSFDFEINLVDKTTNSLKRKRKALQGYEHAARFHHNYGSSCCEIIVYYLFIQPQLT
jgi:hypothetical protein